MPDYDDAREDIHKPDEAVTDEVAAVLVAAFDGAIAHESHGQPVVYLDATRWHDAAALLRDEQQFTQCVDVTAIDHLTSQSRALPDGLEAERYEVVANFLSHARNRRVRLIAQLPAAAPEVASLTDLYSGVDFAERETYDLLGITFRGHPDLTRIQMPDDWVGHPLRKDDASARIPVAFKENPGAR